MRLRRFLALVMIAMAGSSCACPVLDQSYLGPLRNFVLGGGYPVAQTFTVGLAGKLVEVDLDLFHLRSNSLGPPSLQVLRTLSGVPSSDPADVLARIAMQEIETPQLVAVDLSAFDIFVDVNDILAVAIYGSYEWIASEDRLMMPMYPQGMVYIRVGTGWAPFQGLDVGFRTHIDVPEPISIGLVLAGLVACLTVHLWNDSVFRANAQRPKRTRVH